MRPNAQNISHTRTAREESVLRLLGAVPCVRDRATLRTKRHEAMYNGEYNAQWSMQMSIQVASAKDAHSGTLVSARARTQAHTTTHRETTHTDRTDHSHRARATTKLRGVTRRASYAVRAA